VTFFFGALTAAINEGSKNKDGLVLKSQVEQHKPKNKPSTARFAMA